MIVRIILRWMPWIAAVLSTVLITGFLCLLHNTPTFDDGLRHFAMGQAMVAKGISNVSGWSQWFSAGYLHDHVVDPWFLSDVLYVPLAGLPVVVGLNVFTIVSLVVLLAAFALCLRELRVSPGISALLIFMLVFGHMDFTHRLLAARPFVIVSAVSLLLLWSVLRRWHWMAGLLIVALVLLSHLFVLSLTICVAGVVFHLIASRRRDAVLLGVASVIGIVIGFALHPAALEYAQYIADVFLRIPFLSLPDRALEIRSGVGEASVLFPIATLLALVRYTAKDKRCDVRMLLECLTILFFLMFLAWERSIDFLWPLLLLLLGARIADGSLTTLGQRLPKVMRALQHLLPAFIIVFCVLTFGSLALHLKSTDGDRSLEPYRLALSQVESGAHVLNVGWETFSPLVAVRPDIHYATGIDPAFTSLTDSGAYALFLAAHSSLDAFDTHPPLDASHWLKALLKVYPSDYLFLEVLRYKPLVRSLREIGLRDVSGAEGIAVFRVR